MKTFGTNGILQRTAKRVAAILAFAAICCIAAVAQTPSGTIKFLSFDHNRYMSGDYKLQTHWLVTADNLKGKKITVSVYFYDSDKRPLADMNGSYNTTGGNVAVSESATPSYDSSKWSDFDVTIPNTELHLPRRNGQIYAYGVLWYGKTELAHSDFIPLMAYNDNGQNRTEELKVKPEVTITSYNVDGNATFDNGETGLKATINAKIKNGKGKKLKMTLWLKDKNDKWHTTDSNLKTSDGVTYYEWDITPDSDDYTLNKWYGAYARALRLLPGKNRYTAMLAIKYDGDFIAQTQLAEVYMAPPGYADSKPEVTITSYNVDGNATFDNGETGLKATINAKIKNGKGKKLKMTLWLKDKNDKWHTTDSNLKTEGGVTYYEWDITPDSDDYTLNKWYGAYARALRLLPGKNRYKAMLAIKYDGEYIAQTQLAEVYMAPPGYGDNKSATEPKADLNSVRHEFSMKQGNAYTGKMADNIKQVLHILVDYTIENCKGKDMYLNIWFADKDGKWHDVASPQQDKSGTHHLRYNIKPDSNHYSAQETYDIGFDELNLFPGKNQYQYTVSISDENGKNLVQSNFYTFTANGTKKASSSSSSSQSSRAATQLPVTISVAKTAFKADAKDKVTVPVLISNPNGQSTTVQVNFTGTGVTGSRQVTIGAHQTATVNAVFGQVYKAESRTLTVKAGTAKVTKTITMMPFFTKL